MKPFSPTDRLTATLEAQHWNQVLAALGEIPHRLAAPIIQALQEQLAQQEPLNPYPKEAAQ